jgi:hypothetical protein
MGRVRELEALQDLLRAPPRLGSRQVVQPSDHLEVLETGQVLVHGCELTRETDHRPQERRVPHHIEPGHDGRAFVGLEEGREDPDGGGLAGTVRPEQPEDRALLDRQIHPFDRPDVAEGLVRLLVVMIAFAMGARISTLDDTDMSAG